MRWATIYVSQAGAAAHHGRLRFGPHQTRCALGAAGIAPTKYEGDRATPQGRFALRRVWWRADRRKKPRTAFETVPISPKSGWCDAPDHSAYNRPIHRPFAGTHERLWRHDRLYDVFFELGYNDAPVKPARGSAIFLHLRHTSDRPTLGCVAVCRSTMDFILRHARPGTDVVIG